MLAILGLLVGVGAAQGADLYDPSSGQLSMTALTVGGAPIIGWTLGVAAPP
jgi:hypothetical protein